MSHFTPISSLAGGLLIGTAASLLLWLNGRIAGISNISRGLLGRTKGDTLWRVLFLGGLVAGAGLFYLMFGHAPQARTEFPGWLLGIAGVLVGFGTSLANGCTSGHGVCGLGRLSPRSLVATLVFLVTGILTAFVIRHLLGVY
jgi:uncharacterized membrane protein YedE/YeeE